MTDAPAEQAPPAEPSDAPAEAAEQGNPADDTLGDAGKQAIERMKAERNDAVRAQKVLAKELETFRKASMSDAEKQVAEAETRGRQAAASEFGKRLATSEIRAAAATAGADLKGVFDYLDLARFVGEDGEPDDKAIAAFVKGLPRVDPGPPSSDGGARSASAPVSSMDSVIRRAAGLG